MNTCKFSSVLLYIYIYFFDSKYENMKWLKDYNRWSMDICLSAMLLGRISELCENTVHNPSWYLIFPNSDLAKGSDFDLSSHWLYI